MKNRIISAIVGIAFAIFVFTVNLTSMPWLFNIVIALFACFSLYEILLATNFVKNPGILIFCFTLTAIIQFIPIFPHHWWLRIFVVSSTAFCLLMMLVMIISHKTVSFERGCLAIIVTYLVALPYFSILYIYWQSPFDTGEFRVAGQALVILCFAIAWLTDSCAFFTGKICGKHKLAQEISPNKTLEGAIGGVIFGNLLIYAGVYLCTGPLAVTPLDANWTNLIITSFVGSIVSIIGDLSFSMIKRSFGVKDFGKIMPGHGGLLDRFDSVLFVCPVVCVMNMFMPVIIR